MPRRRAWARACRARRFHSASARAANSRSRGWGSFPRKASICCKMSFTADLLMSASSKCELRENAPRSLADLQLRPLRAEVALADFASQMGDDVLQRGAEGRVVFEVGVGFARVAVDAEFGEHGELAEEREA